MELVNSNFLNFNTVTRKDNTQSRPKMLCTNLNQLEKDTVSFNSAKKQPLKKTDFKGIDYTTIEKYKVDISGFKSTDDLQNWANEKIKTISEKDFGGRQDETKVQRKALLKEWIDYVTKENDAYTPVMQLAILDAVTKGLKPNTDDIPPSLNRGILADTMSEVVERLNQNPKDNININKLYQTKLSAVSAPTDEDGKPQTDYTGWVVIPSKKHDPKNFEANVDRLKALSHKNWCTKTFNAEPYLREGDFHVYLENGYPKLGVRFVNDEIKEIQGELNNSKIPQKYFETAKQHINDEGLKLTENAQYEIEQAELTKQELVEITKKLGAENIKSGDAEKILPYFGIEIEKDENGMLTISHYKRPSENYSFEDLGVNENKLFSKIKEIKGDADFGDTLVTDLGKLQTIGGDANFFRSSVTFLGKLQSVGGNFRGDWCKIKSLRNLKSIGGTANFIKSDIADIGQLQFIGSDAYFGDSNITDLGQLKSIGGKANFELSKITNLGQLKSIGGLAFFQNSKVISLGQLETIGGDADLRRSVITDLGELKSIGGNAIFNNSKVTNIGKLQKIGGHAYLTNSKLKPKDFENIDVKGEVVYNKNIIVQALDSIDNWLWNLIGRVR